MSREEKIAEIKAAVEELEGNPFSAISKPGLVPKLVLELLGVIEDMSNELEAMKNGK